jgi:hypothetical protein
MASPGVAPCAAVPVSSARAEASRRNGARSRGPVTPEGKARAARNALKHGLRAHKYVVLPDEDAAEFAALETALIDELAPQGVLQSLLAQRIARAAWRLDRADRLEAEVLEARRYDGAGPGLALIRDGNATRSFDTLLRYRGAALAELMRSLRTLEALRAEPAARPARAAALATAPAPGAPLRPAAVAPIPAAEAVDRPAARDQSPIEPKSCGNPRKSAPPDDRPSVSNSGPAPSLSPWRKALKRSVTKLGDSPPRSPITGIAGCCARAKDQAVTELLRNDMNSRRLIRSPRRHAAGSRAGSQCRALWRS